MARPRVFLVDDHQMVLDGFCAAFRPHCRVAGAVTSGYELLRRLPGAAVDVVLVDLQMPEINGLELIPEIRQKKPSAKIIALTQFADRNLAKEALALGADGYVPKAAGLDDLLYAIRQVMAGRRYLSPLVPKTSHRIALGDQHLGLGGLTARDYAVFLGVGQGKTLTEIASQLDLTVGTVSRHNHAVMKKLGFRNHSRYRRYAVILYSGFVGPLAGGEDDSDAET